MLWRCDGTVDRYNRERAEHGTTAFPIACYHDDLHRDAVPWHWHDELEAAVVTEGEVEAVIGGDRFVAGKGDGFFVNAGVLHSCCAASTSACRLHSMCFQPRLVGGGAESVFHQRYVAPVTGSAGLPGLWLRAGVPWQAELLDRVEAAWQACVREPARYELLVREQLSRLLADLAQRVPPVGAAQSRKGLRDEARVKGMLQFIMERHGEALTAADIARSAAISESECLRCFRATIGTTPMRYLREYRVERAAQLLAVPELSVAEVAARCGFQDVSYFTKTFRELKGMPPGAYRRQSGG